MNTAYISTAYLGPIQLYTKLLAYDQICLETQENYLKQTYRNRCIIAAANGPQALTVPIVKPDTLKCLTKDIRISDHGNWRHLHWNALVSAYRMSPFFEYYEEDFAPFYEKKYEFLLDFNEALREVVCQLIDIQPQIHYTTDYQADVTADFREIIRPQTRKKRSLIPACSLLPGIPGKTGFPSESQYRRFTFQHGAGKPSCSTKIHTKRYLNI